MDEKNLTIGDIARELGVSKTTVSRAISGKGRIGAETREKVLQYIEEHNYRPNVIAKGLAQSRTFNIGLVMPGDYNVVELPFFQNCMLGISKVASSMDYDVLISVVTAEDISQLQRAVINHKIDGVILTRTLVEDAPAKYLKEMQIPFVAIGSTEDRSIIQIDNDHRSACRELTEKLLTQGIRKIALIGGNQSYMVTKNRLGGFMEAYTRQGLELEKEHIYLDVEDGAMVKELVQRMIKEGIECIITMDDYLCSCVLNTLQQLQIHVPEQVKVASFYDSSFLENHVPSITSIQFDVEELGRMTCKTLLGMIEGEAVPEKSLLGYEISLRNSTEKTVLVQNR
ncbi:MAG: LacI family DNA-binding transcriptional regulator [Lachnospiraceae bacterium]|nr:LacI family DNA-binding transcriptional regulator [Lachnospiraceae bacterium]